MSDLPFSPAAARNAPPLQEVLSEVLIEDDVVLEIGAGTGQHAVHMANAFPHVTWQPSDREENLATIAQRVHASELPNLRPPARLDVFDRPWPQVQPTVIFTANTFHIMPPEGWPVLLDHAAALLPSTGRLVIYGPFRARGQELELSNLRFEQMLQREVPHRGIRVQEDVIDRAHTLGFRLRNNHAMPANNRCLVFERISFEGGGDA